MFAFASPSAFGARAFSGAKVSVNTAPVAATTVMTVKDASPSMPWLPKPPRLDPSLPGYAGFDPIGLSSVIDPKWLQESEVKHGRICMLAVAGIIAQEFVHLPGEVFSEPLATAAWDSVPKGGIAQIILFCGLLEYVLHKGKMSVFDMHSDPDTVPGELGFNPLKLKMDDTVKAKEIKNGRLAMCAVGGFIHSMFIYKTPIIAQLSNFTPMPGLGL